MTILDEEFRAACEAVEATHEVQGTGYRRREDAGDVVVMQAADRTNVSATGATRDLIEDFRPAIIMVCGIAGGIRHPAGGALELGDVVVPDYLHYSEFTKLQPDATLRRYFAYDHPAVSLRESLVNPERRLGAWAKQIRAQRPESEETDSNREPQVHVGSLIAGEKIMGNPDDPWQQEVLDSFQDAIAVDMESIGVARAIHELRRQPNYNPRLLIVRGISDMVGQGGSAQTETASGSARPSNTEQRATWKEYAAASAASFMAALVGRAGTLPSARGPDDE